jgi:hypothetical protein
MGGVLLFAVKDLANAVRKACWPSPGVSFFPAPKPSFAPQFSFNASSKPGEAQTDAGVRFSSRRLAGRTPASIASWG